MIAQILKKKENPVETTSTKLAYMIENKEGTKVLNAPKGKWIDKDNLFEEDYAMLNQVVVPSLKECEETLAWLDHTEEVKEDLYLEDIKFKYVKVTFEIIGDVS